jgi:hypothetical protein
MDEKLKALLEFVKAEERVCPMPDYWNRLWEMLPDRKRVGMGWEPPLPLILDAWWNSSPTEKEWRLEEHIRYGLEHGVLDEIDEYLRGLKPDQWFYGK